MRTRRTRKMVWRGDYGAQGSLSKHMVREAVKLAELCASNELREQPA
ncbi:MAG: hypothetical protein ACE5OW_07055 [Candidatus Bathyarchaeia archaeon]